MFLNIHALFPRFFDPIFRASFCRGYLKKQESFLSFFGGNYSLFCDPTGKLLQSALVPSRKNQVLPAKD
ncbi:MAG: hypothetical protein CMP11_06460 [Zetaproteobacteria bacterium]|nr:hypothetical protein [Pseudobdellovibrionaceae bacterium]